MSRTFAIVAMTAATLAAGSDTGWSQSRALLEIRTLSSRPQFVSGGDALIEVAAQSGTRDR